MLPLRMTAAMLWTTCAIRFPMVISLPDVMTTKAPLQVILVQIPWVQLRITLRRALVLYPAVDIFRKGAKTVPLANSVMMSRTAERCPRRARRGFENYLLSYVSLWKASLLLLYFTTWRRDYLCGIIFLPLLGTCYPRYCGGDGITCVVTSP